MRAVQRVACAGLALLGIGLACPASAGTVQDAATALGHGNYATAVTKIKSTTTADWLALQVLAAQLADTLYREIAYDHLARIRPDPAQPVLPPSREEQKESRAISREIKADPSCRFALSFYTGGDDQDVRLWTMPDGAPITTLAFHSAIRRVAISQHYVAVAGPESVSLYDVRTGSFLRTVEKPRFEKVETVGLYFSQDGKQILIVPELLGLFQARGARLFEAGSGAELSAEKILPPPASIKREAAAADCPVVKQRVFSQ